MQALYIQYEQRVAYGGVRGWKGERYESHANPPGILDGLTFDISLEVVRQ